MARLHEIGRAALPRCDAGTLVSDRPTWLQIGVSEGETGSVPGFVIAIFVTLLILFNSFAVNMWLQYRRIGRWRDPLFAEKAYLVLSLVAKSALAWQVYAGALAGS